MKKPGLTQLAILGCALFLLSLLSFFMMVPYPCLVKCGFAEKKYGFKDIPFGTKYQEVARALRQIGKNASFLLLGRENSSPFDMTVLYGYSIGGKRYDVEFFFDHKHRFYSFWIKSASSETADYLDSTIAEEVNFLTEIFKTKYGNPKICKDFPSIIKMGNDPFYWVCAWDTDSLLAFTGVHQTRNRYRAQAEVFDKKLFLQHHDCYKKSQAEKAIKGAKDF